MTTDQKQQEQQQGEQGKKTPAQVAADERVRGKAFFARTYGPAENTDDQDADDGGTSK